MTKNKKIFILVILVAIAIRVFLMFTTYHPDLSSHALTTYFFSYQNVTNPYDHLANLPADHPLVKNWGVRDIFIYPPLAYFTLGTFQKIFQPLLQERFFLDLMSGVPVRNIPQVNFQLFLIKFPFLLIDLSMAFFLSKLFDDPKKKKCAAIIWLFNPVTLYATFSMGTFDIIPATLTILSLLFTKRKKFLWAAVMIGLGTAFKSYPLFLLPFVALAAGKGILPKIKTALAGFIPYFLTILPFLSSAAFKYMVFGPKSQKMFYMEWMLTGAEGIYPFVLFYTLLIFHASRHKDLAGNFWKYFLAYFLIFLSVTHYHPQWFLWLSPFLVIELVTNHFKNLWFTLLLFSIYVFIIFTFDNSLSVGLFALTNPSLANFPGIANLIARRFDINFIKSIARSIFAGASLYLIADSLQEAKSVTKK